MNLKSLFKLNLSVIRTFPKSTKVHFAYLSNTKKFIFANGERESNFLCKLSGKAVKIIWTVVDMVWPVTRFFSCNGSLKKKKKKNGGSNFQETFMANEAQLITNVVNPWGSEYVRMFYCWIFSITFSKKRKKKGKKKGSSQ